MHARAQEPLHAVVEVRRGTSKSTARGGALGIPHTRAAARGARQLGSPASLVALVQVPGGSSNACAPPSSHLAMSARISAVGANCACTGGEGT